MKLYQLLFEAAKSPEDAIESELGLFVIRHEKEVVVVLISTTRCEEIVESYNAITSASMARIDFRQTWLSKMIGKRAVIGSVVAEEADPNVWRVSTSVAVAKYGPMLYDVIMGLIYPAYLRSDYSLTDESRNVWNKMLQRKDVEAVSVDKVGYGDDPVQALESSFEVADLTSDAADQKEYELDNMNRVPKDWFKKFVESLPPEDKEKLGPFYAYRKKTGKNLSKYNKLLDAGDDIVGMFEASLDLEKKHVEDAITIASRNMFERLYEVHQ